MSDPIGDIVEPVSSRLAPARVRSTPPARADDPALIGDSPVMQRVRDRILRLAQLPWPTRVEGERGTGKRVACRLLHAWSPRALQPLEFCNVNLVPDNLELAKLSEDPIGLEGGMNPYVYTHDDPINFADPLGTTETECKEGTTPSAIVEIMINGEGVKFMECKGANGQTFYIPMSSYTGGLPSGESRGGVAWGDQGGQSLAFGAAEQRSFGQCFSQNTAPVRQILAKPVAVGTAAIGGLVTGAGYLIKARGNVMVMRAFASGNAAAFIGGSAIGGATLVEGGGALLAAGTWGGVAVGGLLGSYFVASAGLCLLNPEY